MSALAPGLALAVLASVALNASYLLQHAGSASAAAVSPRAPVATLRSLLASRRWAAGGALGLAGWAVHLAALSRAPLSLVQAFVAGGVALLPAMIAVGLRVAPRRGELAAVALMVCGLLLLAAGLRDTGRHAHASSGALAACLAAMALGAAVATAASGPARRPVGLGLAGGLLYGAADVALKAVTGASSVATALAPAAAAAAATALAFFAFQRGLQLGRPLAVIAVMTAATNVSSVLAAFVVFGDPLGATPALAALHAAGFALIVAAGWWLAPAQARALAPTTRDDHAPTAGAAPAAS